MQYDWLGLCLWVVAYVSGSVLEYLAALLIYFFAFQKKKDYFN